MTSNQEELKVHLPFREETFSSISRAVNGAMKAARMRTASSDGELLRGRRIDAASSTDTTLVMRLDDGSALEFSLGEGRVEWTLHPNQVLVQSDRLDPLFLKFRPDRPAICWNRQQLFDARIGHSIQMIFPGTDWVYFYVDANPILLIQRIIESETGKERLYWCDSD